MSKERVQITLSSEVLERLDAATPPRGRSEAIEKAVIAWLEPRADAQGENAEAGAQAQGQEGDRGAEAILASLRRNPLYAVAAEYATKTTPRGMEGVTRYALRVVEAVRLGVLPFHVAYLALASYDAAILAELNPDGPWAQALAELRYEQARTPSVGLRLRAAGNPFHELARLRLGIPALVDVLRKEES